MTPDMPVSLADPVSLVSMDCQDWVEKMEARESRAILVTLVSMAWMDETDSQAFQDKRVNVVKQLTV